MAPDLIAQALDRVSQDVRSLHARFDSLGRELSEMRGQTCVEIAATKLRVDDLDATVNGNGRPGLKADVAVLKAADGTRASRWPAWVQLGGTILATLGAIVCAVIAAAGA